MGRRICAVYLIEIVVALCGLKLMSRIRLNVRFRLNERVNIFENGMLRDEIWTRFSDVER